MPAAALACDESNIDSNKVSYGGSRGLFSIRSLALSLVREYCCAVFDRSSFVSSIVTASGAQYGLKRVPTPASARCDSGRVRLKFASIPKPKACCVVFGRYQGEHDRAS